MPGVQNNMIDIVRKYIVDNFLFGEENGLNSDTSFLDEGLIDSMAIIELVAFLEDKFNIKITDDELIPQNLDSLNNIEKYLLSKMK